MELALSLAAVVISLLSVGWQWHTWRQSGARPDLRGSISAREDEPAVLTIQILNKGRSAYQVQTVVLESLDRRARMGLNNYQLTKVDLPLQIDAGHSVRIDHEAPKLAAAMAHHNMTSQPLRVMAALGDGTRHRSKGTLTVLPSLIGDAADRMPHQTHVNRTLSSTSPRRRRPR